MSTKQTRHKKFSPYFAASWWRGRESILMKNFSNLSANSEEFFNSFERDLWRQICSLRKQSAPRWEQWEMHNLLNSWILLSYATEFSQTCAISKRKLRRAGLVELLQLLRPSPSSRRIFFHCDIRITSIADRNQVLRKLSSSVLKRKKVFNFLRIEVEGKFALEDPSEITNDMQDERPPASFPGLSLSATVKKLQSIKSTLSVF